MYRACKNATIFVVEDWSADWKSFAVVLLPQVVRKKQRCVHPILSDN